MFEWDEAKRPANLSKHGIDFQGATELWAGPFFIRPGRKVGDEQRWIACGMIGNRVVSAIFVQRGDIRRIISIRRARSYEKSAFEDYTSHR